MKGNYLDFIPVRCGTVICTAGSDGHVTVVRENRGFFNMMAQRFFGKPEKTYIHLDELGSFVLLCMDGTRTVYEISCIVRERFGEKAEPLFDRLVQYVRSLEAGGIIELQQAALDFG